MTKITEKDFIEQYKKYNGCQAKLASHYKLSERSIRNYKAKFIKKTTISKDQLTEEYCVNLKSIVEISNQYNVSRDVIYSLIKKYKLSRESKYDIELLRKACIEDNANNSQLLKLLGISSRTTLKNLLTKYRIVNPIKQRITELYIAGYTNTEIAECLHMSEELVSFNLKHHSIYREKKLEIPEQELLELRVTKTLDQLAEQYKCSTRTISAYIKKYNGISKIGVKKFTFDLDTIKELYEEQNLTMDEIASIFGCCRKTVNSFIRDNNITSTNKENSYERRIREFFVSNNIVFEQNNRNIIKPKEIDFYIPSAKLGIEICGLYWHSTKINKNKFHIKNKQDLCEKAGIRLITIFEDELISKFDIVLNRLAQVLNINKAQGYARHCKIKQISSREGIDFLNKYHLQGSGKNTTYIGAFLKNKLVSVMSFNGRNPAKGHKHSTIELNRFVNPFNIVGIASKLFKYYVKTFNPGSVISYSDNRWNTGLLYTTLGFKELRNTNYNYWYVVRQERKHRYAFTKQRLLALFPEEDPQQTEEQIAEKHNLYRIYDCGSKVYRWQPQ